MKSDWQSASQSALAQIQDLVAKHGLRPGDRLPGQRELSERLGISRPALREALAVLETLGVLRIVPGRGVFVAERRDGAPLDLAAAWHFADRFTPAEIYQLRFAIEGFTARMAARRASRSDLARLRGLNAAMRDCLAAGDFAAAARRDFELHMTVIRISGNRAMEQITLSIEALILETQLMPLSAQQHLFEPIGEHEALLRAIESGDAELAGVTMRHHIARAAERVGVPFQAG